MADDRAISRGKVNAVAGVLEIGRLLFWRGWRAVFGRRRTADGWKPIFDKEPVASIGALALAPSNPKIITWERVSTRFLPTAT